MAIPNLPLEYLDAHVMEPSNGCRLWPYRHNRYGYGVVFKDKKLRTVASVTCERWAGSRPAGMQTAHLCGNAGCWAGEHLRWATARDNTLDKWKHGTMPVGSRCGAAKLDEGQVGEIRKLYREHGCRNRGEHSMLGLSKQFGVSVTTIHRIIHRRNWKHVE